MRLIAVLLLIVGCAQDTPPPPATPVTAASVAPVQTETREPVRADPRLLALAEQEDPDLRDLTPEEIKAELARANYRPGQSAFREIGPAPKNSKWEQMGKAKQEREEQYERRLQGTGVATGPDGLYHRTGCDALRVAVVNRVTGEVRYQYVGKASTLAAMRDADARPHGMCGAPDYRRAVIE